MTTLHEPRDLNPHVLQREALKVVDANVQFLKGDDHFDDVDHEDDEDLEFDNVIPTSEG